MYLLISIHAPLAGRDYAKSGGRAVCGISIHAPLAGRDSDPWSCSARTPISIHAPLAGRDTLSPGTALPRADFNPRAPCGARLSQLPQVRSCRKFQSTRPLRGATLRDHTGHLVPAISIHAPLAGRDAS